MILWTDGEATLLATGRGVARVDGDGAQVLRFNDERATRREEPAPPAFLAVLDAGGRRALLERDGVLVVWELDEAGPRMRDLGPAPRAALALADGRLLVARGEVGGDGRERTTLAVVRVEADATLTAERTIVLPQTAPRARGTFGVWTKTAVPWPEDGAEGDGEPFEPTALDVRRRKGGWQGAIQLHANAHGVVVTSTYSGLVLGLDPATLAPRWHFRLPTSAETALSAVAIDGGVLATVCLGGREASLLHLAPDGEVRAQRGKLGREPAMGLGRPLLVDATLALVTNDGEQVHEITVAELAAKRVTLSPFGGDLGIMAHASTPDGATHVIALGDPDLPPHKAALHRLIRAGGRLKATPVTMPDLRPAERKAPVGPPRHAGPPSVGITAGSGVWTVAADTEVDLLLSVTSKGGPAPGVWIELAGAALDTAIFEPLTATSGATAAAFVRAGATMRAELGAAALEPAYIRASGGGRVAKGEAPDPVTSVAIRVRGLRAGSALLMVRIGPITVDGQTGARSNAQIGSAMQGRTISVTSAPDVTPSVT